MKLTALEIKQQSFDKTLRGYDVAEVQAFLNMASAQWESMTARIRELRAHIEELNGKVKHYEKVELALHETLLAARESAENRMEDARKDARILIDKARHESESILREAMVRKQEIRQSANQLLNHRGEMINGLRAYLERSLSTLEQFDEDVEGLFKLPHDLVEPAPLREIDNDSPNERADTGETAAADLAPDEARPSAPPDSVPDAGPRVEKEARKPDPETAGKTTGRHDLDDILDELD